MLDDLELVHVTLNAPGVPAFGQSGMDRIPVATQVAAEPTQFGSPSPKRDSDKTSSASEARQPSCYRTALSCAIL
jgi:hypothetical protein